MNIRGARAVVTGGAGFIGSELVRQLVEAGAQVSVLDNLQNGALANLQEGAAKAAAFVHGDVLDAAALHNTLRGCNVLFHLACLGMRHSIGNPLRNHEVNATGTLHVLEAARAARVRRIVHVSTSEVYGDAERIPMTEDHPTLPKTVYGVSKLAGENYARAYHCSHGLPVVILRPFNSFGPRSHGAGDAGEVIPRFLLRLRRGMELPVFGDGAQTRDFTYVGDTAKGILLAGFSEGIEGRIFNLGSGVELSMLCLAKMLAHILGGPTPRFLHLRARPGDVLRQVAGSALAHRHLGWEPALSLGEGLRATVEWFAAHPDHEPLGVDEPPQNWHDPAT